MSDFSPIYFLYIIGIIIYAVACGGITNSINKRKGYKGGFAWGFFLGVIGIVIVASKKTIVKEEEEFRAPSYADETVELKHFSGWKCANCGKENKDEHQACPECGNAKTAQQENVLPKFASDDDFLAFLYELSSAAEIAEAFELTFAADNSADAAVVIGKLNHTKASERSYRNTKGFALKYAEGFIKHKRQLFDVDRSGDFLSCPVCGREQTSDRENCFACGALFRD